MIRFLFFFFVTKICAFFLCWWFQVAIAQWRYSMRWWTDCALIGSSCAALFYFLLKFRTLHISSVFITLIFCFYSLFLPQKCNLFVYFWQAAIFQFSFCSSCGCCCLTIKYREQSSEMSLDWPRHRNRWSVQIYSYDFCCCCFCSSKEIYTPIKSNSAIGALVSRSKFLHRGTHTEYAKWNQFACNWMQTQISQSDTLIFLCKQKAMSKSVIKNRSVVHPHTSIIVLVFYPQPSPFPPSFRISAVASPCRRVNTAKFCLYTTTSVCLPVPLCIVCMHDAS